MYRIPEASLIVLDLQFLCTAVHLSLFWLILAPLLSLSIKFQPKGRMEYHEIYKQRKEERMRQKMRELHELPSSEMVKSGTKLDIPQ